MSTTDKELKSLNKNVEIIPETSDNQNQKAPEQLKVNKGSIIASIAATFMLRLASRTSFVVLGFYLGENFKSAVLVGFVIEAFYISELLLAPVVGSLSDRKGRKPFMLYAPLVGIVAAVALAAGAFVFPRPNAEVFDLKLGALLLIIMVGRLLEGAATALNAPANLGYLTDATVGSEKLRAQVLTAFQAATIGGLALGIPFGGQVSQWLGTGGFVIVIALYAVTYATIHFFMVESLSREEQDGAHGSVIESLNVVKDKRIFTFVPAWLAINTLIGGWLSLIIIMLAYPTPNAGPQLNPNDFPVEARPAVQQVANFVSAYKLEIAGQDADARHPNQLLYGGFKQNQATLMVGAFGVIFLIGMGLWTIVLARLRRTTVMMFGLVGLVLMIGVLTVINGLASNPLDLTSGNQTTILVLLPLIVIGGVLLAGFTPASLTHLGAISETLPGKRGAVMGLYSVLLGVGQLLGTVLGGVFVDAGGFYGLMIYSAVLALVALASVLYMRSHKHDLIKSGGH